MSHTHRHTHPTTYHTHTTPQSLTCVDQLYEARSLPWSVVNIPHFSSRAKHFLSVIWIVFFSDTPLEKTEFPSPTAANCKQAPWLGVGLCVHFPFSVLILSGLKLCRSCACFQSCYEFLCSSVFMSMEDTVSLESFITSGPQNLSVSPFHIDPEPWGRSLIRHSI